jgi:hypothetical protein
MPAFRPIAIAGSICVAAAGVLLAVTMMTRTPAPERVESGSAERPISQSESRLAASPSRMRVSAAQSSAALASGDILHPVESLVRQPSSMTYGNWLWNDRDVGSGTTWVRVDLSNQLVSIFRGGHEIGTAVMMYGVDQKPTPTGVYPIKAKIADHHSSLYGSPMPYTLRLTDDGVSIHASDVRYGAGTHGCIGIPKEFAERLFKSVERGDPVLIVGSAAEAKADPKARPVNDI